MRKRRGGAKERERDERRRVGEVVEVGGDRGLGEGEHFIFFARVRREGEVRRVGSLRTLFCGRRRRREEQGALEALDVRAEKAILVPDDVEVVFELSDADCVVRFFGGAGRGSACQPRGGGGVKEKRTEREGSSPCRRIPESRRKEKGSSRLPVCE